MELCHMYRNGYKNIRLTDGDKNEYVIPREVFGTYESSSGMTMLLIRAYRML